MVLSPVPPMMEIKLPRQQGDIGIVKTFAPGSGEVKLEPGGKVTYTLVWDQRDSRGQQVPPRYYTPNIEVRGIKINGEAGPRFGTALDVLIQPSPGPGEKVLEISQSQTVKGITFTLERIEQTTAG